MSGHVAGGSFGPETGSLLRKDTAGAGNTRRNMKRSDLPLKGD